MSNLFMPKDQKNLEDVLRRVEKNGDDVLVYPIVTGDIFAMDKFNEKGRIELLEGDFCDVIYHKGLLYGGDSEGAVWDVLKKQVVYEHEGSINCLGVFGDRLFLGDSGGQIVDVFADRFIDELYDEIYCFAQFKDKFYCGAGNALYDIWGKEVDLKREGTINALFNMRDTYLLEGGADGLFIHHSDDEYVKDPNIKGVVYDVFDYNDEIYILDSDNNVLSFKDGSQICELDICYNLAAVPRRALGGKL